MNMNRLFYYMIYHRRNLWSDSLVRGVSLGEMIPGAKLTCRSGCSDTHNVSQMVLPRMVGLCLNGCTG